MSTKSFVELDTSSCILLMLPTAIPLNISALENGSVSSARRRRRGYIATNLNWIDPTEFVTSESSFEGTTVSVDWFVSNNLGQCHFPEPKLITSSILLGNNVMLSAFTFKSIFLVQPSVSTSKE